MIRTVKTRLSRIIREENTHYDNNGDLNPTQVINNIVDTVNHVITHTYFFIRLEVSD